MPSTVPVWAGVDQLLPLLPENSTTESNSLPRTVRAMSLPFFCNTLGTAGKDRRTPRPCIARRRQRHADLQPVDHRRLGQGLEQSATPDVQCTFAPGTFKNGQIGNSRSRRASAPAPGRCAPYRAAMSRPNRTAPAINPNYVGGKRSARDRRRFAICAADIRLRRCMAGFGARASVGRVWTAHSCKG